MRELKRTVCLILAFLMLTGNMGPVSLLPVSRAEALAYAQEELSLQAAPEEAEEELSRAPAPEEALPSAKDEESEAAPPTDEQPEEAEESEEAEEDKGAEEDIEPEEAEESEEAGEDDDEAVSVRAIAFQPNGEWRQEDSRYAAVVSTEDGDVWMEGTDRDKDGRMEFQLPADGKQFCFVRMAAGKSDDEQSDDERSDKEWSDKERSDKEQSDDERSDKEQSDKEQSDKEQSDDERSDDERSDKERSDDEQSDEEESDEELTLDVQSDEEESDTEQPELGWEYVLNQTEELTLPEDESLDLFLLDEDGESGTWAVAEDTPLPVEEESEEAKEAEAPEEAEKSDNEGEESDEPSGETDKESEETEKESKAAKKARKAAKMLSKTPAALRTQDTTTRTMTLVGYVEYFDYDFEDILRPKEFHQTMVVVPYYKDDNNQLKRAEEADCWETQELDARKACYLFWTDRNSKGDDSFEILNVPKTVTVNGQQRDVVKYLVSIPQPEPNYYHEAIYDSKAFVDAIHLFGYNSLPYPETDELSANDILKTLKAPICLYVKT